MAERFPRLRKFVRDTYAPELEDTYKQNLLDRNKVSSGDLVDSIKVRYRTRAGEFDVIIDELDYGIIVEEGRSPGTFPPVEAMLEYVRTKPIIGQPIQGRDSRGRFTSDVKKPPTENQLAFLIGRKIKEQGIPGTFALADARASTNILLQDQFDDLFRQDIEEEVGEQIKSIQRLSIG